MAHAFWIIIGVPYSILAVVTHIYKYKVRCLQTGPLRNMHDREIRHDIENVGKNVKKYFGKVALINFLGFTATAIVAFDLLLILKPKWRRIGIRTIPCCYKSISTI